MDETKQFDGSQTMILAPGDLKVGMYVSYLDRPWADAPFPFQGFRIESEAELRKLKETCEYVFVSAGDSGKSYQDYFARRAGGDDETTSTAALAPAPERLPTETEFPAARTAHGELRDAMIECYRWAATGRAPDLTRLERAARLVIDSVQRNPDALLYFVRTQTDGDYIFRHGVACAVMLCALGCSQGKSYQSLKTLTMGGALLDIGKTRVPADLLNRSRATELTPGELQQLRRHVERGAEIVSRVTSEGSPIVTMIMAHHERYDGSGYPRRLSGNSIPRFAQLAGIVDMFDAMISERSYGRRATPYEAMRFLRSRRDADFSHTLVDAFRAAFGSYPTGTLVELSNGEVGFVIQQSPSRLQPRVYVLLDGSGKRLSEFRVRDLAEPGADMIAITNALKPGSYGIDY